MSTATSIDVCWSTFGAARKLSSRVQSRMGWRAEVERKWEIGGWEN